MQIKTFTKNDESFICRNCNKKVEKLNYTSRDHCPYCLYSIHIDINPGDRQATCLGNLVPYEVINSSKKRMVIKYKCDKCGIEKNNKAAIDDDYDLLLKYMSHSI